MLGSLCSTFDYTTRRAGVHAMVQAFAPVLRLTGMQRSEQDGAHPRAAGRHTSRVEFQVSSLDLLDAHRAGSLGDATSPNLPTSTRTSVGGTPMSPSHQSILLSWEGV